MKNLLKFTFISAGIALSTSAIAQDIKKDASTTATQLETPKPAETKKDAPSKQEPVKPGGTTTGSKSDAKSDTTKTGGTRMAITEQGMPKKNKNRKTASTTAPDATKSDPPKKKENN